MPSNVTEKDLRVELAEFQERYPKLTEDEVFVLWFLRAFLTGEEEEAAKALSGGSKDKGVDAVLFDDETKTVFIVQGKYRRGIGTGTEKRGDVTSFAQLAVDLCGDGETFKDYAEDLLPEVEQRLNNARNRLIKRGYQLQLLYVTTGKCSRSLTDEAKKIARRAEHNASFQLIDGKQILLLLADYLDGVAPPVPSLELEIELGRSAGTSGVLQRYDHKTGIESWVFSMAESSVAAMYKHAGIRLFARNVRGFLGNTQINRGMEATLDRNPEFFWYFNNGITIVCDDAERKSRSGADILQVTNPQVINGQQTTRILATRDGSGVGGSVLVRVIRVPRDGGDTTDRFETLVSEIVAATNWQNAIRASDLMCNDRRQIEIERQFRKLGYHYLRKRMTVTEARRHVRVHHRFMVKKEELAQAVAACDLDPAVVREGKENLFQERWYRHVFPTGDPLHYLTRYRLLTEVSYAARGYPERAYAKCWSKLNPVLRGRAARDLFRQHCERQETDVVRPLNIAVDKTFRAALAFYRGKRGAGATALDVSTFFKRKKLDVEFSRYWGSSANSHRNAFNMQMKKLSQALADT